MQPHPTVCRRHIGPAPDGSRAMLKLLGYPSLDAMVDAAVPKAIRLAKPLQLPAARSETRGARRAEGNRVAKPICRSFIGMGYYDCITRR